MDFNSCTEKCKSQIHGDVICAALTKRDVSDVELCAFFNQVCCCCESVRDSLGHTALQIAASVGRVNVLKWLLRRKQININGRDNESGYTALHRSIFYGQINCAVELLQAGANSNTYDYENLSCLDHAMKSNPFNTTFYDGEVYVWGSNINYIFGIQQARHSPELWDTFHKEHPREAIRQISLGKFHCVMVSREGNVYSCGHGQGGRLGLGSEQTALSPKLIKFADSQRQAPFYCIRASIARDHTIFLTESDDINYVWTCGLNTHHVLGISPVPQKLLSPKRLVKFKSRIEGVCAARYHSVAWGPKGVYTWGLHGGQLGHDQNMEKYVTVPKLVTCLTKLKSAIHEVVTSSGATIVATKGGDIFVLHEYQCRKISSKQKLLNLVVTGGRLNTALDAELLAEKNAELKILVLTENGRILLWQESDPHLCRCVLSLNRDISVAQVVMNMCEILFVNTEGEAFHGTIKNRRKRPIESSSLGVRNSFHKFLDKDECHSIKLTKLPKAHRAVFVATDSKGGNFAIIQTNPKNGLCDLPDIELGTLPNDMLCLLNESDIDDYVHDVVFKVNNRTFPAHQYIIACTSVKLKKMMLDSDKFVIEINNTQPDIFEELLLWIYTGKCNLSNVGACPKKFLLTKENLKQNTIIEEVDVSNNLQQFNNNNKSTNFIDKTDVTTGKDPIRLLQELAKRFEVTELEKQLSKLATKDGMIVYSKGFDAFLYSGKKSFNHQEHMDLYDVNIISKDGKSLQAHKCILVARVEFFQRLYSTRWNQETPKSDVPLPYNKNVLDLFLEFVYTDELMSAQTIDSEILHSLLVLSDQYFILRLKEICEVSLCALLSFKNAVQLLTVANVYNAEKLKTFTMKFICLNLAAFLESRGLENLDYDFLNQLTDFYCRFNPKIQTRVITPYSIAPSDEEIKNISNLYPISLDLDESSIQTPVQSRPTPKSLKKRIRSHKSSTCEPAASSEAFVPEKLELEPSKIQSSTVEELDRTDVPSTSTPFRIKAISSAHEKIKLESEAVNFVKLPHTSPESNNSDVFNSSYVDFPLLSSPKSNSGLNSKPLVKHEKVDRPKIQKISQKQRKRLSSEESSKDTSEANCSASPKNPWKVCDLPSPVGSPDAQTNIGAIINEEKKSKENFNKMKTKRLTYTQIEDKAIEDLQKFYNSNNAIEEVITLERVCVGSISIPTWVQKTK